PTATPSAASATQANKRECMIVVRFRKDFGASGPPSTVPGPGAIVTAPTGADPTQIWYVPVRSLTTASRNVSASAGGTSSGTYVAWSSRRPRNWLASSVRPTGDQAGPT